MNTQEFDRDAYLRLIGYDGKITPSVESLKALHHAQLYTIPFENFDIQLDKPIEIHSKAIFEKIVRKKRGGYCFELNGLFLMALQSFSFDVRPLLARVHVTGTPSSRSHQIELITLAGKQWIADVGFGADTPRVPIPLELNKPTIFDEQKIRLVDAGHFGTMLQAEKNNGWIDLYSFDLSHVFSADLAQANHFTSTHPGSLFVSSRIATLPVKSGAMTLLNNTLKKVVSGKESVQELPEGQAYMDALKEHFRIEIDEPFENFLDLSTDI